MSTYDRERDPSGRRAEEVGDDVGEREDEDERPPGGETPREDEVDPTAGENPS